MAVTAVPVDLQAASNTGTWSPQCFCSQQQGSGCSAAKLWGVQPQPLGMGLLGKNVVSLMLRAEGMNLTASWEERQLCDTHSRVLIKNIPWRSNCCKKKWTAWARQTSYAFIVCSAYLNAPYVHTDTAAEGQGKGEEVACRFSSVPVRGRQGLHSLVTMDQNLLPGLCSLICLFLLISN